MDDVDLNATKPSIILIRRRHVQGYLFRNQGGTALRARRPGTGTRQYLGIAGIGVAADIHDWRSLSFRDLLIIDNFI